jgi:hypothetical protein
VFEHNHYTAHNLLPANHVAVYMSCSLLNENKRNTLSCAGCCIVVGFKIFLQGISADQDNDGD